MEALTGLSILIIAVSVIALMMIFYFVPIGLYITAYFSGVKVRIFKDLIGMRLRKVSPQVIVRNLIAATKAGIELNASLL